MRRARLYKKNIGSHKGTCFLAIKNIHSLSTHTFSGPLTWPSKNHFPKIDSAADLIVSVLQLEHCRATNWYHLLSPPQDHRRRLFSISLPSSLFTLYPLPHSFGLHLCRVFEVPSFGKVPSCALSQGGVRIVPSSLDKFLIISCNNCTLPYKIKHSALKRTSHHKSTSCNPWTTSI